MRRFDPQKAWWFLSKSQRTRYAAFRASLDTGVPYWFLVSTGNPAAGVRASHYIEKATTRFRRRAKSIIAAWSAQRKGAA